MLIQKNYKVYICFLLCTQIAFHSIVFDYKIFVVVFVYFGLIQHLILWNDTKSIESSTTQTDRHQYKQHVFSALSWDLRVIRLNWFCGPVGFGSAYVLTQKGSINCWTCWWFFLSIRRFLQFIQRHHALEHIQHMPWKTLRIIIFLQNQKVIILYQIVMRCSHSSSNVDVICWFFL